MSVRVGIAVLVAGQKAIAPGIIRYPAPFPKVVAQIRRKMLIGYPRHDDRMPTPLHFLLQRQRVCQVFRLF
jgi:hypothetical protein